MRINMRNFLWAPLSILMVGFPVLAKSGLAQSMPASVGSGKTKASVVLVDEHHGGRGRGDRGRWDRGDRGNHYGFRNRGDWDRGRWGRGRRDWDDYYYGRRYYNPNYGYYGYPYPYTYGYNPYGYVYPYSYPYYGDHSYFGGFLRLW